MKWSVAFPQPVWMIWSFRVVQLPDFRFQNHFHIFRTNVNSWVYQIASSFPTSRLLALLFFFSCALSLSWWSFVVFVLVFFFVLFDRRENFVSKENGQIYKHTKITEHIWAHTRMGKTHTLAHLRSKKCFSVAKVYLYLCKHITQNDSCNETQKKFV